MSDRRRGRGSIRANSRDDGRARRGLLDVEEHMVVEAEWRRGWRRLGPGISLSDCGRFVETDAFCIAP